MGLVAAVIYGFVALGLLTWAGIRSGHPRSKGLACMALGILIHALAVYLSYAPVIAFLVFILGLALIWAGFLTHVHEYHRALLHGDPEDQDKTEDSQ